MGLMVYSPTFNEVITSTFSGNEASFANRGSMTMAAMDFFFNNPLGHGLGATSHSNAGIIYFAESFLINTAIQIGMFGLIFMAIFYYKVYKTTMLFGNSLNIVGRASIIALTLTGLVSVNTNEVPFNYFIWMIIGLSFAKIENENIYY
jgi:hypothetical protein